MVARPGPSDFERRSQFDFRFGVRVENLKGLQVIQGQLVVPRYGGAGVRDQRRGALDLGLECAALLQPLV